MTKKYTEENIAQILSDDKKEIFEEERSLHEFRNLFQKLRTNGIQEKEKQFLDSFEEINSEESYDFPLSEYLARRITALQRQEFNELIQDTKYVWEYNSLKVAQLFRSIDMNFVEAKCRIKEQLFHNLNLGTVMARSDNTTTQQLHAGNTEFATRIQQNKRETFLLELEKHFR